MYNIIICDTREKGNKKILEYFEKVGQDYIISKLDTGDYMLYKNYEIIIDKKDGLLELSHNLCNTTEHERIKREILRAKEKGCKKFIFLIQENKIKTAEDIKKWKSPYTKVNGYVLYKVMLTMQKKYEVKFIITSKKDMGALIIKLLGGSNDNTGSKKYN